MRYIIMLVTDFKNIPTLANGDDSLVLTPGIYANLTYPYTEVIKNPDFETRLVLPKKTVGQKITRRNPKLRSNFKNKSMLNLTKILAALVMSE